MTRSLRRRVLSRAHFAHAARILVWIAMMAMAATAQASPGDTELVSVSPITGMAANSHSSLSQRAVQAISADGRYIVFMSSASDLVAGVAPNGYQIYLRDRGTGTTELISAAASGLPGTGDSVDASISADGRYVTFTSAASDLIAGDTNRQNDVFVRDRETGLTERVSVSSNGTQVGGWSDEPSISATGRYVAFRSSATRLVTGDTNGRPDVFVHDCDTGITTRVSVATDTPASASNSPSISGDGRYVAFAGGNDVFVRDRQTGTTERVSVSTSGGSGNGQSFVPAITPDGRYVAFVSWASNLVSGDNEARIDVFVRDRVAGTTELVNLSSTGLQDPWEGNKWWRGPSISADGRYVAFVSDASTLVPGDTNNTSDVFVRDRQLRTTALASVNSSGLQGTSYSDQTALSADGRFVVFTYTDNHGGGLAANDTNGFEDVYVHELGGAAPPIGETAFAVKPTALSFGSQALLTSSTLSVWVTNTGTTPLPIPGVALVGLNPGMFSGDNRCGSSLAVGASCSIRVTFRPTSVGAKSAKLEIVAGDNDVRTKALLGTGVVSAFSVAPTALDFGSVPIGTSTAARIVSISNKGSAVLPISSISLAGWNPYQFSQTHNCPANLAVGATCTINVVFKPTTPTGSKAALLNITPGGGAAIRSVALAGAARR